MESDTRRFPGGEPARVDEAAATAQIETPVGVPTTHLPQPGNGGGEAPPNVQGAPRPGGYVAPPVAPTEMFGSSRSLVALGLIALGLFFAFETSGSSFGSAVPLLLGLVFVYAYRQSGRNYGFLIPACILTGLGTGIVVSELAGWGGSFVPFGLGLGFLTIWMIHRAQWWWLIPGGILTLVGMDEIMSSRWLLGGPAYLPIGFIVLGLFLLMKRRPVHR